MTESKPELNPGNVWKNTNNGIEFEVMAVTDTEVLLRELHSEESNPINRDFFEAVYEKKEGVLGEKDPTFITIEKLRDHLNRHSYIMIPENSWFAEGLIVDIQTINALLKVYDAVNEKNKQKMAEMIKTSCTFCQAVEMAWGAVTPKRA